jgi:hypothetical protein
VTALFSAAPLNDVLGGIRGWIEPAVAGAVALWALAAAWRGKGRLDRPLAGAAVLFVVLALSLPANLGTTLAFASRWLPVACTLLVLSLPPLRLAAPYRITIAGVILAGFCAGTAVVWRDFERHEMRGFEESIDGIPPGDAVLGLDFARTSPRIKTSPFYLMHGYATVLRDARSDIARVTHPASLVVHKGMSAQWPWTSQLPWHPERVRASDFDHFDYVILHAGRNQRDALASEFTLTPATGENDWRLYRTRPSAGP